MRKMTKNSKYYCEKCNYSTEKKQYWYYHKKSKKHLRKISENSTDEMYPVTDEMYPVTEQMYPVTEQMYPVTEQMYPVTEQMYPDTRGIKPNINGLYQCDECNKTFTTRQNFYRHRKHRCGMNFECEYCNKTYIREKMFDKHILQCKRRRNTNTGNTIINNNTTNNITNNNTINDNRQINYHIHIYGQEDITKMITDDVYEKLMLKNPEKALGILMKHFYIDTPEHRNVLYTNPKHKHCKIYDGEKWILEDLTKVTKERMEFICKNMMNAMNKRELLMIETGITGPIYDDKEIKAEEVTYDMLRTDELKTDDFSVFKKSKTYTEELEYVNEQKRLKKELNETKRQHSIDLINISDDIKKNIECS
jgi:hypothetical protein